MELFIEEYIPVFFFLAVSCNRSFDTVLLPSLILHLAGHNRRWKDTGTIDRYCRSILSVILATDSIDLSVSNFSFMTDSIDYWSPPQKKNFLHRIEPSAYDFFF
jgi:hypothetical protein